MSRDTQKHLLDLCMSQTFTVLAGKIWGHLRHFSFSRHKISLCSKSALYQPYPVTETLVFASFHRNLLVAGLMTLAFARLDILWHHCKFQFEFYVHFFECCVNFDCKIFEMKPKHCNYIAKTKCNLVSTKSRKWVIVIQSLPLQRYFTVTTKKLNWSITINQATI